MLIHLKKFSWLLSILSGYFIAANAHAAGQVSHVFTYDEAATPFVYSLDGTTYQWGSGQNQIMDGFIIDGEEYHFSNSPDRVELRRVDHDGVATGNPCGVFVERSSAGPELLRANYPSDGSDTGNCDMASMLIGRVINRGALDLFSNTGPNPKNVERVDYIFDHGIAAPMHADQLAKTGHVVAEKSGNNPIQIAAILSLDVFGQPASYGKLVRINANGCSSPDICYGITNLRHHYSFFQNDSLDKQGYPAFLKNSTESVGMAFVSAADMGLQAGQQFYGFSYFPKDVDEKLHVLTQPETFPSDSNDNEVLFGDGADIYGGVSGYFVGGHTNVASGMLYKDDNRDGMPNANEAGIELVAMSLYLDSDNNGELDTEKDQIVGEVFRSDVLGEYRLTGLNNGRYFILLDESDSNIPSTVKLPNGANPIAFEIAGENVDSLNFGFIKNTLVIEDGQPSAIANVDEVTVYQGKQYQLDVLSNDEDPVGLGLTIVGFSATPNAEISIEDGKLSYSAKYGFIGKDTFLYEVEDAMGNLDSASVNVDVKRFSDINANGINDYDECGCDDLSLEVGVRGAGIGSTSWVYLIACLSLLWIRCVGCRKSVAAVRGAV